MFLVLPLRGYFRRNFLTRRSENPCMTLPRQVVPGCDYMVTRRCSERRLFLRPDAETNNAFLYCLAHAAARAKVKVLFSVAMSNHHHTGIHDPDGNFPVFIEYFHGLLARCQNDRGFIEKYRDAFLRYMAGAANVVFPFGTFLLRKLARVACEAADTVIATRGSPAAPHAEPG